MLVEQAELKPVKPLPGSRPGSALPRGDSHFKPLRKLSGDDDSSSYVRLQSRRTSTPESQPGGGALPPVRPPSSISARPRHVSVGAPSHSTNNFSHSRDGGSDTTSAMPPNMGRGPPLGDRPMHEGRASAGSPSTVEDDGALKPPGRRERFTRKPSLAASSTRSSHPQMQPPTRQPPRVPPGHIGAFDPNARTMARRQSMPSIVGGRGGAGEKKAALPPVCVPPGAGRRASITTVTGSVTGRVRVNRFPTLAESMGKAGGPRGSHS